MKEELDKHIKNFKEKEINDSKELENIRVEYLGKSGIVTEYSKKLGVLNAEEKKEMGILVNTLRVLVSNTIEKKRVEFEKEKLNKLLESEKIDITLPSTKVRRGSKHPISRVIEDIEDFFVSMGYDVVDGPEIESDLYNFEMLNIPKSHPARDTQDSFYITEEMLLRTQTSPMQVRTMLDNEEKGPIRIICPGKTYRRDDDATHSHQFGQVEGLVIDKNISISDLKGTLEAFAKHMLGEKTIVRFRPSYFPFTEPSYEVDVSCFKCSGKGCPLCKNTGWIEVFAAGMVHPNVLKMSGYDPDIYSAFAFGPGLDRIAMFKYEIPDIRYLYRNDLRFLKTFDRSDTDEIK